MRCAFPHYATTQRPTASSKCDKSHCSGVCAVTGRLPVPAILPRMTDDAPPDFISLLLNTPFGERVFRHRDSPADRAVIQQCFVQPQYACPARTDARSMPATRRCCGADRRRSFSIWAPISALPRSGLPRATRPHASPPSSRTRAISGCWRPTARAWLWRRCARRFVAWRPVLAGWSIPVWAIGVIGWDKAGRRRLGFRWTAWCSATGWWIGWPSAWRRSSSRSTSRAARPTCSTTPRPVASFSRGHPGAARLAAAGHAVSRGFFRWHAAAERDFMFHAENVFSIDSGWLRAVLGGGR